jgi:2-iminobutanoate/2-iminopropanoate deaminase
MGKAEDPGIVAVTTASAPAAIGPYSQAVAVGDLVFCSGQIGLDPATGEIVPGGIEAETRRVLANLAAVLAAAGCRPDDALRTTIYLADLGDFALVNGLYGAWVGNPAPARSTVGVAALPRGARVEIDVVARRRPTG